MSFCLPDTSLMFPSETTSRKRTELFALIGDAVSATRSDHDASYKFSEVDQWFADEFSKCKQKSVSNSFDVLASNQNPFDLFDVSDLWKRVHRFDIAYNVLSDVFDECDAIIKDPERVESLPDIISYSAKCAVKELVDSKSDEMGDIYAALKLSSSIGSVDVFRRYSKVFQNAVVDILQRNVDLLAKVYDGKESDSALLIGDIYDISKTVVALSVFIDIGSIIGKRTLIRAIAQDDNIECDSKSVYSEWLSDLPKNNILN